MVEHGGHGGEAAVPVAAEVYKHVFGEDGNNDLRPEWPYVAGRDAFPFPHKDPSTEAAEADSEAPAQAEAAKGG
jgi:hypothetical protein